ncbi:MAG: hypothetical protein Q8O67_17370 [Deltaproteobacteria bacterium]|nr:hypothetical protein [Deltaproteobacteria bacterium]
MGIVLEQRRAFPHRPASRDAVEAWWHQSRVTWRRLFDVSDAATRQRALNRRGSMAYPRSAIFVRCHSATTPVIATGLVLNSSLTACDEFQVQDLRSDVEEPSGTSHLAGVIRSLLERVRRLEADRQGEDPATYARELKKRDGGDA